MRRLLAIATVLAVFTVPLALAADTPADGTLSAKRGRGTVVLKLKGTVIGRVARNGRVQVRDLRPFDLNDPHLTCRPHVRRIGAGTWLCKGRNIGFRVDKGRFNVNVRGVGISISAVGRGTVDVDGAGETGVYDGVMSIDSAPYESLPDDPTTYFLGTPPAGG
ncbi:MAG: hypothetical protein ACJ75Q_12845 [Gaiellaceae bacterium]